MKVTRRSCEQRICLILDGELDLATAPVLATEVEMALAQNRASNLVIDATELTFCDAAGIGALLAARDAAGKSGASFVLADVHENSRRCLEITGVLDILTGTTD